MPMCAGHPHSRDGGFPDRPDPVARPPLLSRPTSSASALVRVNFASSSACWHDACTHGTACGFACCHADGGRENESLEQ
jgi:hypothetical protein